MRLAAVRKGTIDFILGNEAIKCKCYSHKVADTHPVYRFVLGEGLCIQLHTLHHPIKSLKRLLNEPLREIRVFFCTALAF